MDTTLEGRRVNWLHIILYGTIAELFGIIGNLVYVYLIGERMSETYPLAFTHEYMEHIGVFIFMCLNFLSFFGVAFWIAKRNRTRTLWNGVRLVMVGIVLELLFYWIVGLEFQLRYAFSFLVYFIAVIFAGINPIILKGRATHRKDWDAHKGDNYKKETRK